MQPNKPDGGPAFPLNQIDPKEGHDAGHYEVKMQYPGMSLRDYFAGLAMAGEISSMQDNAASEARAAAAVDASESPVEHTARISYEMADAMIAARLK